jgi:putative FmdB family regulatory protein
VPIYEYECRKCGVFDYEQSISDRPLGRCPKCRSKVTKLISATAFHLKGGGWYSDGYDRKSEAKAKSADEGGGSTSTEAAPAPATSPKPASTETAPKTTGKKKGAASKA